MKSDDDKKRDDVLKRMLATPPKPHKTDRKAGDRKNDKGPALAPAPKVTPPRKRI